MAMKRTAKKSTAFVSSLRGPFGVVFLERDRDPSEVWLPHDAPPVIVPVGTILEQLTRKGQAVISKDERGPLWWHALLYLAERDLAQRRPEITVPPAIAAYLRFGPPSVRYRTLATAVEREFLTAGVPTIGKLTKKMPPDIMAPQDIAAWLMTIPVRRRRAAALALDAIYHRAYRGFWICELYGRVNNHRASIDTPVLRNWRKQGLKIRPKELPREWSFFEDLGPFDAALAELWWLIQHDRHARLCPICDAWFVPRGPRLWRQGYCADHRTNASRQVMKRRRAKAKREIQAKAKKVKEGRRGKAARAR
jgi:hypothetical protein